MILKTSDTLEKTLVAMHMTQLAKLWQKGIRQVPW